MGSWSLTGDEFNLASKKAPPSHQQYNFQQRCLRYVHMKGRICLPGLLFITDL